MKSSLRAPDGGPADSIAIVMLSALGDAVHVLPVVNAIKRHAPATRISWIIQPAPAALVRGHPMVDEFIVFERARGLSGWVDLRRRLRARRFDVALALQSYLKSGIVTAMLDARVKVGMDIARSRDLSWVFTTHRLPPRPPGHVRDQFLEFLDVLGVPRAAPEWLLEPAPEECRLAREALAGVTRPVVGLVVATSKPEKNWPPQRFGELASRLHLARGATCVLLGGNTAYEHAAARTIQASAGQARLVDTLGADLRVMLALLKECDVVVSPDTGPLHMCVALDVPVVGLFGYTNPRRVGPVDRFRDLLVDGYGNPGENYPVTSGYRRGRMERIAVAEVARKVELALQRYPRAPELSGTSPSNR